MQEIDWNRVYTFNQIMATEGSRVAALAAIARRKYTKAISLNGVDYYEGPSR